MLIEQILKEYGFKHGLTVSSDNIITEWPYDAPIPDAEKIRQLLADAEINHVISVYSVQLQKIIDDTARQKDYENGAVCATYANSTNAYWKKDALNFIAWRDSCWAYALEIQNKVKANEIAMPELEIFIANLPKIEW